MTDIGDVTKLIQEKWADLSKAEVFNLVQLNKTNVKNFHHQDYEKFGAYVIYNKDRVAVYVGSAYKRTLKVRLSELFWRVNSEDEIALKRGIFYHPVTQKLANDDPKRFVEATKDLEENYTVKVVPAKDSDEAKLLEQAFIILLGHPKFNDENITGPVVVE